MSKRNKKQDRVTKDAAESAIRESYGQPKYGFPRPKFPIARRLKCDKCPKTWKYEIRLLHSICPKCKEGRLS